MLIVVSFKYETETKQCEIYEVKGQLKYQNSVIRTINKDIRKSGQDR
jgi:hypothetical protein